MKICDVCEYSDQDEDLFCNECHSNIAECECGNQSLEGMTAHYHYFCIHCGMKNHFQIPRFDDK